MTARAGITFVPRLLPAPEAAAYLGVSASKLATLNIPRKELGAKRLYDRLDLDAYASELPYEGDSQGDEDAAACDRAFGITR
ncbi:DNA-binding protein [Rhodobacter sp. NTK016B]|uniref:DNA-binding protein n=1 Tax=Rhodobacter sp. NTK016B TaxID=2759676 RepID=UPI001A90A88B|nr:DNA-binding protein [Rhodobacter sp. NTK016B]MBN8294525.1 DNA-binding protein [Rhodobacter sp. NTK016B]